jgi:hypothetical protein
MNKRMMKKRGHNAIISNLMITIIHIKDLIMINLINSNIVNKL